MQLSPPETERSNRPPEKTASTDSPSTDPPGPDIDLPLDVVFDLLSNERRRRMLRYLLSESEETTLGEIAEHIASIENDKPVSALSSTERKRVYICLYQCHLPKMDDAGVIDFDEHRKTITTAPGIEHLQRYLPEEEGPSEPVTPWSRYYLGLSLFGIGALAAQSVLFPATWLSGFVLGTLLTAIGLTALAHLQRSDRLPWDRGLPSLRRSPPDASDTAPRDSPS